MPWADPRWSALFAGGYLALLTLMWVGLCLGVGRWGRGWRMPIPAGGENPGVLLSICIPARNEAANIQAAVRAALASRWGEHPELVELVVVDDRSSDGTGALAVDAGGGDPRLRVVEGVEPPAGWAGKPWACARAAGEARGEILFFVDADVVLHPDAALAYWHALDQDGLALLSAFGSWTLLSFWERAVIPTVGWFIRGAVDLDAINDRAEPPAFANGQAIMTRREAYDQVGGHGAVRDQVLEDVRLAEAFKRRGLAIGLRVAPWAFQVRLYRSLREITAGYAKNLYEGMGRRPGLGVGAVLFIAVGTLLPFAAFTLGFLARLVLGWAVPGTGWLLWTGGICALQILFRAQVELRDGRDARAAWTHPLANLVLVWILLRSVFGVRAAWKGRAFVDGRAADGQP